jgi:hypothetical protein
MNSWFVWGAFALVVLALGSIGYHFSLRVLRVAAALVVLGTVLYITWYGLTYLAKTPGSSSDAFARGADALAYALFHPHPVAPGHPIPEPGRIGWLIIAVLLLIGYRELEAWSLHCHARCLDTSALTRDRQHDSTGEGKDVLTDVQRHDRLAAELKFRLPAVEVRSPAILPGGSRSSELASIAETSGVTGSGLAGAIIRFFGTLWPSPRRVRVRVWVECAAGQARSNDPTTVTVSLDDPKTGASIATKTLAASSLDNAASVVAGYVAQHIFADDPTAPPWCTGAADGRDLAAILLARQVRVYPESVDEVGNARSTKIEILEGVAGNNLCAGVARYELAHLYDLAGRHAEALRLHAKNREQYPRFYRGRYRLAMSLEMIANPDPEKRMTDQEVPMFNEALKILYQCDAASACKSGVNHVEDGKVELSPDLRRYLLDTAREELEAIRKYLTLRHVIWQSFWHRDERGILKPYWQLPYRQAFHDGVCVALLLVTVRRALIDKEEKKEPGPSPACRPEEGAQPDPPPPLRRVRTMMRIATTIAGDNSAIAAVLDHPAVAAVPDGADGPAVAAVPGSSAIAAAPDRPPGKPSGQRVRPVTARQRTRRWPGQHRTRSWQAAYNLACVYAALAQDGNRQPEGQRIDDRLRGLVTQVVASLEFALNNRECEMERPWEWITNDPDFSCLHSPGGEFSAEFIHFLDAQKGRDYPPPPGNRPQAAAARRWPQGDLVAMQTVRTGYIEMTVSR